MYYAFERRKIMLNQIVLVPRSYKNIDGEYDTDFIDCRLWDGIAQNANEFCKKGDLLGIWSQHMQYKEIYCILPLIYM